MTGLLRLSDFRNYHSSVTRFDPGINVVIGDNGRGKTNLLEALFFLVQGRSMRTSDLRELVKSGEEEAIIDGVFEAGREIKSRISIDKEGRVKGRKRMEGLQAHSFQPDDIWMIKGGPESRRRYLDEATLEIKRGYRETLREYQRVLKQRNEAIKAVRRGSKGRETIRNWNLLIYRHGGSIVMERIQTAKRMQEEMNTLAGGWGKGEIELQYYTSMGEEIEDEKKTLEKIEKMEEAEIRRGLSLTGPQRDELLIKMAGKNTRRECSQGEQKIVAIMWRIAEAETIRSRTGRKVILLMDDCLSELDAENRKNLMDELRRWEQVVVTATDDAPEFDNCRKIVLA